MFWNKYLLAKTRGADKTRVKTNEVKRNKKHNTETFSCFWSYLLTIFTSPPCSPRFETILNTPIKVINSAKLPINSAPNNLESSTENIKAETEFKAYFKLEKTIPDFNLAFSETNFKKLPLV
jgi:hypothetical protein